jgi:hypothetical protein
VAPAGCIAEGECRRIKSVGGIRPEVGMEIKSERKGPSGTRATQERCRSGGDGAFGNIGHRPAGARLRNAVSIGRSTSDPKDAASNRWQGKNAPTGDSAVRIVNGTRRERPGLVKALEIETPIPPDGRMIGVMTLGSIGVGSDRSAGGSVGLSPHALASRSVPMSAGAQDK